MTSTKQYIRANGKGDDPNPILPDDFIKDDPATQIDETLEHAMEWIREK